MKRGWAFLLAETVMAGDVNACCGVLRRIFSETLQEDWKSVAPSTEPARRMYRRGGHPSSVHLPQDAVATAPAMASSSLTSSSQLDRSIPNDVINFAAYAQRQRSQAHSFANSAAQAVLHTAFVPSEAITTSSKAIPPSVPQASSKELSTSTSIQHGSFVQPHSAPATTSLVQHIWELAKSSLATDPTLVKTSSLHVLCHTAQRTGYWEEALQFCAHLPRPPAPFFLSSLLNPNNVSAVLAHCARCGWALDVSNAIRVLAEEDGSWSAALAVAKDAEQRFPYGEVYSLGVLIPYLAASGAAAQARELFEAGLAQGALMDPALIQQLLMQTATLRQWATCLHMIQCLHRTQETAQLLPTNPDLFRRLMEVSPGWMTSLQLLHIARASEVNPDAQTIAILLAQCDRAGAWREAAAVYDMAVREGFADRFAAGPTYHTLVRSFSALQQWQKALEALSWMSKASDASLSAGMAELVTLCEQSGQWEAALSVGSTLLGGGVHLLSTQTSMALLFASAKGAQWEFAMRFFEAQLGDIRVNPHPLSLCAVLQACAAARQWRAALQVYHTAKASQPRTVVPPLAHRIAIKACAMGGKWDEVIAVLEHMQQDGLPLDNYSQRLGLWAAALQGHWELSLTFLQGIPRERRTIQDRMTVRNAARSVSPVVDAIVLRSLQSK